MSGRAYYDDLIEQFLARSPAEVLGELTGNATFNVEMLQRDAWMEEIRTLRLVLAPYCGRGKIYFEFSVPRFGKRIDVVLVIDHAVFVVEFKVGETEFSSAAADQVWDYALDLKLFHEESHERLIAPILIATGAEEMASVIAATSHSDGLLTPIYSTSNGLGQIIEEVLGFAGGPRVDPEKWEKGRYHPTPTIIEAAMALYGGHAVKDISRSDAGAINLTRTSDALSEIIRLSKESSTKAICFVTGVPGAGKTLIGLNIATKHIDKEGELYSVFLSGNGPLVAILREALARDKVRRACEKGIRITKRSAMSEVQLFIQNVHHFRDDCLIDIDRPPIEHVALFDEAQRAWNREQTTTFMRQKRQRPGFDQSEPEFLISCLERHPDWAVIVCLVGGGQEINTGEGGIAEWINALIGKYPHWNVYISANLHDSEYGAGKALERLGGRPNVHLHSDLHLAVSMRSFRAEDVAGLVKHILDKNIDIARHLVRKISSRYPIVVTRELGRAKLWLRERARGSERYGIVVSSRAMRLKPHAIDVRAPMNPVEWFLNGKEDVRSSYFLEDVATEFHVQGLELDWSCVVWDADFRHVDGGWEHYAFVGDRWKQVLKDERRTYLKNAYRVLLTRARQGMVIVVPFGDPSDTTRAPAYYDSTFQYLQDLGFEVI